MTAVLSGTNGLLQSYDYQVLTTAFSYTFAAGTQVLVINPAGTLATGTITMPAAPADGMTITVESTQQVTALTMSGNGGTIVGTAVQLIPNQPLSWVYRTSNTTWYPVFGGAGRASALVSGTVNGGAANPLASGTSVDFTSIPSWVKRITVMFNGVNTNGSSGIRVQLGTSSGATITGYLVYFIQTGASTANATSTAGFDIYPNTVTNALRSGTFVFTNISGNTWVGSVNIAFVYSGGYYASTAGGSIALANVLDRVRITTVNGADTFDAGSINILYE